MWGSSCIPEARLVASCPGGMSPGLTQRQPLRDRGEAGLGGEAVGEGARAHTQTQDMGPGPLVKSLHQSDSLGGGPRGRGESCTDEVTEGK